MYVLYYAYKNIQNDNLINIFLSFSIFFPHNNQYLKFSTLLQNTPRRTFLKPIQ